VDNLQIDMNRLGEWAFEIEMIINPAKSKVVSFTKVRVTDLLNYSLEDIVIPKPNSCKYFRIICRSKAFHSTTRILKKENSRTKILAYTSLVRPILEYASSCWDRYREGQINYLDRVQSNAAKFAHQRNWETFAERRNLARICALFKAYTGERAWKVLSGRLQKSCYLGRVDHDRKIGSRNQKTDFGKYSFVTWTIQLWNQYFRDSLL
jgi:hypothetical protein